MADYDNDDSTPSSEDEDGNEWLSSASTIPASEDEDDNDWISSVSTVRKRRLQIHEDDDDETSGSTYAPSLNRRAHPDFEKSTESIGSVASIIHDGNEPDPALEKTTPTPSTVDLDGIIEGYEEHKRKYAAEKD
jgi:hypothetical protein